MNKKEIKMFDIRMSDVRRSKALAYKDPYAFVAEVGQLLNINGVDKEHHLYFTRNDQDRFELQLRRGAKPSSKSVLVTHHILNDMAVAIYKDINIKGDLVWLDKIDTKSNEDGTVTIFKKTGLILVQGSKYFGYDMTSSIQRDTLEPYVKNHIYGFGTVIK